MIPILRWELGRRKWFIFWWSIGLAALIALTVLPYGSLANSATSGALDNLGDQVGSFLGTSDLFSPTGYLNSQIYYITLPILIIIASIVLAGSLLGKEESSRTLEVLLARPVGRTKLLASKALAGLIVITVLGAVSALTVVISAHFGKLHISTANLLLATAGATYFSASFGAVTYACYAASLITRRVALLAAVLLSFGSYIIASLGNLFDWLEPVAKALPYHYYDPGKLLTGELPIGFLVYTLAIYAITAAAATLGFRRRDIS
jgi:ABC-2 type transport system permease protein